MPLPRTLPRPVLLALASGCAWPAAASTDPPARRDAPAAVVFGRLNMGVESVSAEQPGGRRSTARLVSQRSVIGFRGFEDLGDGWRLVWQIEGGIAPDVGGGSSFANRDSFVGFEGREVLFKFGHLATPYLNATSGLDPLYPTTVGMANIIGNGSTPTSNHAQNAFAFDRRNTDMMLLQTTVSTASRLQLALSTREARDAASGARPGLVSMAYLHDTRLAAGQLAASLAYERHQDYRGPGSRDKGLKLGLRWDSGPWRLAGVVEHLDYDAALAQAERTAWFVSASAQLPSVRLMLNLARADDGRGRATEPIGYLRTGADTGARQLTLGAEWALSRRTALYGYATHLHNESRAAYDLVINPAGVRAGGDVRVLGLGLRTGF